MNKLGAQNRAPLHQRCRGASFFRDGGPQFWTTTISRASVALPSFDPAMPTWAPTATEFGWILARSLITVNGLPKVQASVKPSADLTVTDVSVIAVTEPRWTTTTLVPLSVWTVASPCSSRLPKPNWINRWRSRRRLAPLLGWVPGLAPAVGAACTSSAASETWFGLKPSDCR